MHAIKMPIKIICSLALKPTQRPLRAIFYVLSLNYLKIRRNLFEMARLKIFLYNI